jgi:nucleotide-binding universal stress UspA family protein
MKKSSDKKALVSIKKILLPVDRSEYKEKILAYALFLAKASGAEITTVHFMDRGMGMWAGKEKERAEELLSEVHLLAKKEGVKINKEVVEESNSVSRSIIHYAKKNNMDVIVIGTKGMTAVEDFFLGSVANNVIHYAHCPVFAIR